MNNCNNEKLKNFFTEKYFFYSISNNLTFLLDLTTYLNF